jgi:hypothetical protein
MENGENGENGDALCNLYSTMNLHCHFHRFTDRVSGQIWQKFPAYDGSQNSTFPGYNADGQATGSEEEKGTSFFFYRQCQVKNGQH